MNRSGIQRIAIVIGTVICLAGLFYLPYRSVKNKTIDAFNKEQMILANQAIKGIHTFFDTYTRALEYFSNQPSIISFDSSGRLLMEDFYSIHKSEIKAIIRMDATGSMIHSVPGPGKLGNPETALEPHNHLIMMEQKPQVSDVFVLRDNDSCIAYSYPIFKDERYAGAVTFLIPLAQLVKNYVASIRIGEGGYAMLISKTGDALYCPFYLPEKAGGADGSGTLQASYLQLPIIKKMMAGEQGATTFTIEETVNRKKVTVTRHAVYAPVDLPGDNYWSIAVATPESQVLATMESFRNQWLLVTSVAIFTVLLLSYILTRTLATNAEEKKRRLVEEQMVKLLDFAPMGIIVYNRDGIITYVNRAVLDIIEGISRKEILGRSQVEFIHPDYKELVGRRFQDWLKGGANAPVTVKVVSPTGTIKDVELDSTPFTFSGQAGLLTTLRDVTEQRKAEETQRRLVTAIEQARESIVITDHRGTIEYVNPAFTDITGYSREEVIGQNPRILKSGEHPDEYYKKMWQCITSGGVWQDRIVNRRKDGSLFTELSTISPVRDVLGKITHFVAVKRDITHEVELESQLRQAQKMEAIGTLAGGIAHDFNNILGAIIGFTDMALLQTNPSDPVYENLTLIRQGGKRAADLVQQILTFSRRSTTEKQPVLVLPLIRESLKLLRASLPSTIEIRQQISAGNGIKILADPVQIQQIVMNLCTNAFHAMQPQGGVLTIRLEHLEEELCQQYIPSMRGKCLRLTIADTGHGIKPEILERIFDPFFTTKEPGEGTGMGLSVVHGVVCDLGGKISVESTIGEGTSFTVILPTTEDLGDQETAVDQQPLPEGKEHILIVDDEPDILTTYSGMLSYLGYQITTSSMPDEALDLIRQQPDLFDLVISDHTMPDMTGLSLIGKIREVNPSMPVILSTGYSEQLDQREVIQTGINQMMRKPVDFRSLAFTVRSVLDSHSRKQKTDSASPQAQETEQA